ncbi:15938_t:CDS:2 [Entrophospora sp. SA101]|nr:15938_t:CDS:2 [Entrophospora sp. SA101]
MFEENNTNEVRLLSLSLGKIYILVTLYFAVKTILGENEQPLRPGQGQCFHVSEFLPIKDSRSTKLFTLTRTKYLVGEGGFEAKAIISFAIIKLKVVAEIGGKSSVSPVNSSIFCTIHLYNASSANDRRDKIPL